MLSPNPQGGNPRRGIGIVALILTFLLVIGTIVFAVRFSASSGIVTLLGLIVGILGAFFSFLQAFPSARDDLVRVWHFPSPGRNQLLWLMGTLIIILVSLNVIQAGFIFGQPRQVTNTSTPTATTPITPTATISTVTTTPSPSPTSSPIPTVLYRADWSQGVNGWSGGTQWSVNNGILMSNGSSLGEEYYIAAPYQPTSPNYAVEAQLQ